MKRITKHIVAGLLLTGVTTGLAEAQVKFKLVRQNATTYLVSMVPQKTVPAGQAITGTMQVSLKVRNADGFQLGEIVSLQEGVEWDKGSLLRSPEGARESDYLSVALGSMGTRGLTYEAGKEVPLFTVKNTGNPAADAQLVDNATEPLAAYKRNAYNINNQLSVLGYGRVNAYTGNLRDEIPGEKVGLRRVFPNPASAEVTVEFDNYLKTLEGEVTLAVAESGSGRVMMGQQAQMRVGTNRATLNVGGLAGGAYVVYLNRQGTRLGEGLKLVVVR